MHLDARHHEPVRHAGHRGDAAGWPARGKRFHTQKISSFVCVHSLLASACLASQLPKAMLVPAFAVDLAAVMCG